MMIESLSTKLLLEYGSKRSQVCLVDNEDLTKISGLHWKISSNGYAVASRDKKFILMHRLLMNLEDRNLVIDHINKNKLDNRKINLRVATSSQNNANSKMKKNNKSGYKGVSRVPSGKWLATIRFKNKQIHIGTFKDKRHAAHAYNQKALELFGEFASINEI